MKRIRLIAIAFVAALQSMHFEPSYAEEEVQECSREILLSYFPEPFVKNSLEKFNVDEASRAEILSDLGKQDQEVIKKVEEKASKLDPNPLKTPVQREKAVQLFRETLLEVFSEVMKRHGETNDQQIQSMLDDIQHQKAKYFVRCMERQKGVVTPSSLNGGKAPSDEASKGKSLEDEDDDDQDDDDDEDEDDNDDDDDDYPSDNRSSQPQSSFQRR